MALYPNLIGFTMNILQRLIVKQVSFLPLLLPDQVSGVEAEDAVGGVHQVLRENQATELQSAPPGAAPTHPRLSYSLYHPSPLLLTPSLLLLPQVPPPQLRLLLDSASDLREPLLEHVQGFTEAQRQHVPGTVMEVGLSYRHRRHYPTTAGAVQRAAEGGGGRHPGGSGRWRGGEVSCPGGRGLTPGEECLGLAGGLVNWIRDMDIWNRVYVIGNEEQASSES